MDQLRRVPDPGVWRVVAGGRVAPGVAGGSLLDGLQAARERDPWTPALVGTEARLDRATLLDDALRIAHAVDAAVPAGGAIATLVSHSPAGIAAILGCLLAGRICIPLNAADPAERLDLLMEEAAPAAVLTDSERPIPAGVPELRLADCGAAPAGWTPPSSPDPDAACMIHFTSGSSGRPKGIVLSHHAVLCRARECIDALDLTPADRFLASSAPSVGSGFSFILAALFSGATMLVARLSQAGAGPLLRLAARERATVLIIGPPIMRALLALPGAAGAFADVRHLRMGASGLLNADAAQFRAQLPPSCVLSHTYASTEALVVAHAVVPDQLPGQGTVPVGRLCAGREFALLGADDRPVADGEVGELVLRGRHIALGEWRGGRIVPGRMIADPTHPDRRIFHTGDLMRLDPDGTLRFVGRADRQVKVNGVRIELAEIEAALRAESQVRDAAVVQATDGTLHAFIDAPAAVTEAVLRARLRRTLPTAMRPGRITIRDTLPALPGGKVDIQALRRLAG